MSDDADILDLRSRMKALERRVAAMERTEDRSEPPQHLRRIALRVLAAYYLGTKADHEDAIERLVEVLGCGDVDATIITATQVDHVADQLWKRVKRAQRDDAR